jgi:hypothetical protein
MSFSTSTTSTAEWEIERTRRKRGKKAEVESELVEDDEAEKVIAQFVSSEGDEAGPRVYLPLTTTPEQLEALINDILQNV